MKGISSKAARSAPFLLAGPGTIAGVVPLAITRLRVGKRPFGRPGTRWLAVIPFAAAVALVAPAITRFATQGGGTPAPNAPPERLVTTGPYRSLRNPMYLALLCTLLAEAFAARSRALLAYTAAVAAVVHGFVVTIEEPRLQRRFGAEYDEYRRRVPRWIPRLRPTA